MYAAFFVIAGMCLAVVIAEVLFIASHRREATELEVAGPSRHQASAQRLTLSDGVARAGDSPAQFL